MLIKSINFPNEVLQAQREERLVLFAGAGISMPAPSDLPSFAKLAEKIGKGASPRPIGEVEDRYLGRLVENGIRIHQIARDTHSGSMELRECEAENLAMRHAAYQFQRA